MKILIFLFFVSIASAQSVYVPAWGDYKEINFTQRAGEIVSFTHKNGVGKINIRLLPLDIQKKLKGLPEKTEKEKKKEFENKVSRAIGVELTARITEVVDYGVAVDLIEFRVIGEEKFKIQHRAFIWCETGDCFDGQIIKGKFYKSGNFRYESKGGNNVALPSFAEDMNVALEKLGLK